MLAVGAQTFLEARESGDVTVTLTIESVTLYHEVIRGTLETLPVSRLVVRSGGDQREKATQPAHTTLAVRTVCSPATQHVCFIGKETLHCIFLVP